MTDHTSPVKRSTNALQAASSPPAAAHTSSAVPCPPMGPSLVSIGTRSQKEACGRIGETPYFAAPDTPILCATMARGVGKVFTGIVEEVGRVTSAGTPRVEIACGLAGLALGDSIAVDGVCLTVTGL